MLELFKKSPRFFVGAILVHVFFIVLFGVGFHFKSQERAATTVPESVKVTTIDEKEVKKELAKLKAKDEREERRKQEAIKKRKAEERRLQKLKKERELALKKEKELKEKQRKEKQRQAELERQRKAEEEKDRAKKEAELKEKMRAEEERMQAEAKAEAEAAALRKAELKKKQTLIDKHMNMIEVKIYRHWIKPPTASQGLEAELRVKLIPTGDVISVELTKSSGDAVYDKSVIAAVKKASPLPLPPAETGLFDTFRELRLPMRADKKT
jgi:colicin import membrane protein